MTWYEGIVLGLLQGATEFLPVSSSGHLVMGQTLLGLEVPGMSFEVALHVATLVSVVVVYRVRIGVLLAGVGRRDREQMRYAGLLVLASVPAAIAGIGFGDFFASLFDSAAVTGVALLVTGCVVWSARGALARGPAGKPGIGTALLMGLAQAAAIVPGISRSGATVVAALWRGVDAREAAAFAFLMSVPAVAGAALLKVPELVAGQGGGGVAAEAAGASAAVSVAVLGAAAAVACVTGVAAIRAFRAMLASRSLHRFAPYLWGVGAAFLWLVSGR
ncbi:MAG: undecaprenyl-diphosphate phosphatase [Gemmatimonadota bacterium]|nr:undecaprenyl-diphosphate phosphatase [Gemmatimonadota bacterium]MDE2983381.1 undecaprenyl-diphosphate phosphatase [Gemmatimonadota bacterium]